MQSSDYDFLSDLLHERSGLSLGPGKDYLLDARLTPVAQSWGLEGIPELVEELRTGDNTALGSAVVEAFAANETQFFRDLELFQELRERLLPSLIARRQSERRLRIWSAAVSTGQELYSLAILLHDAFPEVATQWQLELLGTDISQPALERAAAGIYSQFEAQRGLSIKLLMKHFQQVETGWQIKDSLRRGVCFQAQSLLESFSQLGTFDMILCRNVLIYFENDCKRDILERMSQQLADDGCLILGAGESVLGITDGLVREGDCRSAVYGAKSRLAVSA